MLFWEKMKQNKIYVFLVLIICVFTGVLYSFNFMPEEYSISKIIPIIISIVIGVFINCIYICALMVLDKKIKNSADVEVELYLKTLAEIPLKPEKTNDSELINYSNEKNPTTKGFKNLVRNIQFLCVNNEKNKKVILVTSSVKGEGKSFVAANMGIAFSNIGKKVLIIDANMNSGRQDKIFNTPNELGLSNYLSKLDSNGIEINEFLSKFINETEIKNLNLITSGTVPPNSSELLTSTRLEELIKDAKVFFDTIIIDSDAILNSTEALILSRAANSCILVAEYKETLKEDIKKAKRDIKNVGGNILGVVINKTKTLKTRKTKAQRREEFSKFRLKVKEKINQVKVFLKNKFKDSEQKLLEASNKVIVISETEDSLPKIEIVQETKKEVKEILEETKKEESKNKQVFKELKEKISNFKKEFLLSSKTNLYIENENIENEIVEDDIQEEIEIEEKETVQEEINKPEENVVNEEKNNNLEKMQNTINEKYESLKSNLKENFGQVKNNITNLYAKGKEIVIDKFDNKEKDLQKENTTNTEKIENSESKPKNKEVLEDDTIKNEKRTLVIVDAENGCCRIFSKDFFIEKLIRGIDRIDGMLKAQYSLKMRTGRIKYLVDRFRITEKQAERIDPLVYITLAEYDDTIWIERKMPSDMSEKYVMCMAEEYPKEDNENERDYIARCQRLRKGELEKLGIDIEYKLDNLWRTSKINISDKIALNKFAKAYEIDSTLKNDKEILKSKTARKFYSDIIKGAEKRLKNAHEEELKKEEEERITIEEDRKIKQEELELEQKQIEMERKAAQERIRLEQENIKAEKRQEQENLKNEKRKEKEIKRIEKKEEKDRIRREKQKQKEESKIKKEMVREKQREEAKLEEELLEDNLYPKTKFNKDL